MEVVTKSDGAKERVNNKDVTPKQKDGEMQRQLEQILIEWEGQ